VRADGIEMDKINLIMDHVLGLVLWKISLRSTCVSIFVRVEVSAVKNSFQEKKCTRVSEVSIRAREGDIFVYASLTEVSSACYP
jgi:hypothetical protein